MKTKSNRKIPAKKPDVLFERVVSILEQARGNVVRAVNTQMVLAYWLIGREIVEELQGGKDRAAYGRQVVKALSVRLIDRYGRGFSAPNVENFRRFYLAYAHRLEISYPLGRKSSGAAIGRRLGDQSSSESAISFPLGTKSGVTPIVHPMGAQSSDSAQSPTGPLEQPRQLGTGPRHPAHEYGRQNQRGDFIRSGNPPTEGQHAVADGVKHERGPRHCRCVTNRADQER